MTVPETSPRLKARIAGVFYLLIIPTAVFAELFWREPLFRLGFASDLIATACYIAVTALFYGLFKPVNRSLSLLAAFFSLVGCAIGAFSGLFHLAPLVVLGGAPYLSVFSRP